MTTMTFRIVGIEDTITTASKVTTALKVLIFLKRQTTISSAANTNDWTSSIVAPVEMRRGAVVACISFSAFTSESFCEKKNDFMKL